MIDNVRRENQLFKVGDKVKILPTIRSEYPDFPYIGVVGRVCAVSDNDISIGVEFFDSLRLLTPL